MKEWLQLAFVPSVRQRAVRVALGVGSLLLAINHGDALLRGDVSAARILRMVLTVVVPYLVSTFSSVGAIRELRRSAAAPAEQAARPGARTLERIAS
ncbi:MAG TPA: nitrate/nitrite transporter NrtS [Thermoanaerobaculia bacterium]|nr:nitrate/nitrite transporter NrtS [Thermoanaerobaculia bacterium]